MVFVYILGKVEVGKENNILNSFESDGRVKRASLTYGAYDLCIEAEFESMENLDDFIFNVVRKISGIESTASLVVARTIAKES